MKKTIIKLDNVWKIYHMDEVNVTALSGMNIEINDGEFVAVIGPSGSGKSTCMNMIGCLDVPSKGSIFLEEHDISKLEESELAQIRGRKIGFVFQTFNLIPTLNAVENVMLPMTFQNIARSKRLKLAKELLAKVGLKERIEHLPGELSVGKDEYILIKENKKVKPIKIGDFVDRIIKKSKNIEKIKGVKEGIRTTINEPIEIATFNDKYEQEFSKLNQVVRHKTNSVYEIKTEYGYKIKCTGAHSIFIYKDGKILPKKVSDLKIGETVPFSMKLPNECYLDGEKIDLANELKKFKEYNELIITDKEIRFKVSHLKDAISREIKIDNKLCRILGDLASEGCVRHDTKTKDYYITFTLGITEIDRANLIKDYFRKIFGIKLREKIWKEHNTITLMTGNKLLSFVFLKIFNVGNKSYGRDFSDILFNVSDNFKLEFLAGVYGDGTHRKIGAIKGKEKRREISIKTTSEVLAKKLNFLFLQLGYVPAIENNFPRQRARREVYKVSLYGNQCEFFANELNFRGYNVDFLDIGGMGKIDILPNYIPLEGELLNFVDTNRDLFTTKEFPGIGGILRQDLSRKSSIRRELLNHFLSKVQHVDFNKIAESDTGFVKIKEIKKIDEECYVYDVSDENHRFIGTHGIYLHNSGGERQRVAIARALSNDPDVILADEPTGNLDSKTGKEIMEMLKNLNKKEKKTIVMVTHDLSLTKYAERVIHIKDGKNVGG